MWDWGRFHTSTFGAHPGSNEVRVRFVWMMWTLSSELGCAPANRTRVRLKRWSGVRFMWTRVRFAADMNAIEPNRGSEPLLMTYNVSSADSPLSLKRFQNFCGRQTQVCFCMSMLKTKPKVKKKKEEQMSTEQVYPFGRLFIRGYQATPLRQLQPDDASVPRFG